MRPQQSVKLSPRHSISHLLRNTAARDSLFRPSPPLVDRDSTLMNQDVFVSVSNTSYSGSVSLLTCSPLDSGNKMSAGKIGVY